MGRVLIMSSISLISNSYHLYSLIWNERNRKWKNRKIDKAKRLIKLINRNNTDQKKEDSGATTLGPIDLKFDKSLF